MNTFKVTMDNETAGLLKKQAKKLRLTPKNLIGAVMKEWLRKVAKTEPPAKTSTATEPSAADSKQGDDEDLSGR